MKSENQILSSWNFRPCHRRLRVVRLSASRDFRSYSSLPVFFDGFLRFCQIFKYLRRILLGFISNQKFLGSLCPWKTLLATLKQGQNSVWPFDPGNGSSTLTPGRTTIEDKMILITWFAKHKNQTCTEPNATTKVKNVKEILMLDKKRVFPEKVAVERNGGRRKGAFLK